jgi:hypothetical protein
MSNTDLRNKLRAKTVGAKKDFRRTEVEFDGLNYEFVQPTLRGRKTIIEKSRNADGDTDDVLLSIYAVIELTVIPGTEERIYEDTDLESMLNSPAGSFVDVFAGKAVSVMLGADSPLPESVG